MKTKFIAYITAGAIAFTGVSAPAAQAGSGGELARFLVGVGVIAIIANEVNKNQNRRVATPPAATPPRDHRRHPHPPRRVVHNPKPPQTCLRQRLEDHGWKKYYSHRCLERQGWTGSHRHW